MQRILVVEDNLIQLEILCDAIKKNYPSWDVQVASNYEDAMDLIDNSVVNNQLFSLFLFDVQLSDCPSDKKGFLLSENIRKIPCYYKTPLLFLTAVSDKEYFALSNYHCYNYISKPYTSDDILHQINQLLLTGYLDENTLSIRDTDRILRYLDLNSVYYIESYSHTLKIHMTHNIVSSRQYTLDTISVLLPANFVRCHKKYIVNMSYVNNCDKVTNYIHMNNLTIPIGRTYITNLNVYFDTNDGKDE